MKRHKRLLLGFLLIVSLACGNLQARPNVSSFSTIVPGAVNTYIAQTAELASAQTAAASSPTPTITASPTATMTASPAPMIISSPLPTTTIIVGKTQILDEDIAQQNAAPSPQSTPLQPTVREKFSITASFSSSFYMPKNGSFLNVHVSYFGDIAKIGASNLNLCASITEQRRYESGGIAQVSLTDECQSAYLLGDGQIARVDKEFFFIPSGYSFVWIDSPEGRYQITEIRASIELKQNEKVLESAKSSHRPAPVRLSTLNLSGSLATATVEIMAGTGESYTLTLKVFQIEIDPDEVFWSSFLLFAPCLFPEVCNDSVRAGGSSQPIKLIAGTTATISASYSKKPISEEGNIFKEFKAYVYFEGIIIDK